MPAEASSAARRGSSAEVEGEHDLRLNAVGALIVRGRVGVVDEVPFRKAATATAAGTSLGAPARPRRSVGHIELLVRGGNAIRSFLSLYSLVMTGSPLRTAQYPYGKNLGRAASTRDLAVS